MEFVIDERDQPPEGSLVASPPPQEQPGDLRGVLADAVILSARSTIYQDIPLRASIQGLFFIFTLPGLGRTRSWRIANSLSLKR